MTFNLAILKIATANASDTILTTDNDKFTGSSKTSRFDSIGMK